MRVARVGLSIAVILLIAVIANPAFGCTCVRDTRSLKQRWTQAFDQFETIVYATVTEATIDPDGNTQRASLRVDRSWKGSKEPGDTILAVTAIECCVCGIRVDVGDTLVVALNSEPYEVAACPGDDPTSPSPNVFKILDRLKAKHAKKHGT